MLVMNRPRFSTCRIGSSPFFHSAMRTLPLSNPVSTPTYGSGSVSAKAPRHGMRVSPGFAGAARLMYRSTCSGVPHSWIGANARLPARLPVAAPPSTHDNSNATSASARFFGPAMNPPCSSSMNAAVRPASSIALSSCAFCAVHSCELRAPSATMRATGPRATRRADCTSICRSITVGEPPHDLAHVVAGQRAQRLGVLRLRVFRLHEDNPFFAPRRPRCPPTGGCRGAR